MDKKYPNRAWCSVKKLPGGTWDDGNPKADLVVEINIQPDAKGRGDEDLGLPVQRYKAYLHFREGEDRYNGWIQIDDYDPTERRIEPTDEELATKPIKHNEKTSRFLSTIKPPPGKWH